MESSARLCLADAIRLYDDGQYDEARARALKSLKYSIGILADDYKRAVLTQLDCGCKMDIGPSKWFAYCGQHKTVTMLSA
jgi:hypothetical protein